MCPEEEDQTAGKARSGGSEFQESSRGGVGSLTNP